MGNSIQLQKMTDRNMLFTCNTHAGVSQRTGAIRMRQYKTNSWHNLCDITAEPVGTERPSVLYSTQLQNIYLTLCSTLTGGEMWRRRPCCRRRTRSAAAGRRNAPVARRRPHSECQCITQKSGVLQRETLCCMTSVTQCRLFTPEHWCRPRLYI